MISFDLKFGGLHLDDYFFSAKTDIELLRTTVGASKLELWSSNEDWNLFRFVHNDMIVIFHFKSGFLKMIELFSKDKMNSLAVSRIITELDGKQKYVWGTIEINSDLKAGYESILIKFL